MLLLPGSPKKTLPVPLGSCGAKRGSLPLLGQKSPFPSSVQTRGVLVQAPALEKMAELVPGGTCH